jgi:hypothetical protein
MEHIIYLPEFRVVVCKECQCAILPSEIESHFKPVRPHGFAKEARQEITNRVAQIRGLIQNAQELEQCKFPFPIDTAEAVIGLAPPRTNGLRCTFEVERGEACQFVAKNIKRIQEHSWEEHGWKSTNKGGRPRKSNIPREVQEVPWRSGVQYQRFFTHGPKSGFFEVRRAQDSSIPIPKSAWVIFQEQAAKKFQRVEEIRQRKIEATDESREPNP